MCVGVCAGVGVCGWNGRWARCVRRQQRKPAQERLHTLVVSPQLTYFLRRRGRCWSRAQTQSVQGCWCLHARAAAAARRARRPRGRVAAADSKRSPRPRRRRVTTCWPAGSTPNATMGRRRSAGAGVRTPYCVDTMLLLERKSWTGRRGDLRVCGEGRGFGGRFLRGVSANSPAFAPPHSLFLIARAVSVAII